MWIPLIFAVLFLAGAVANTFGSERNLAEAVAGYSIALCLFEIWRFLRRNARQLSEFSSWFIANRVAIEEGTADYNGMSIDPRSELTQFSLAMSFGVISLRAPSRYYVIGQESTFFPGLYFTVSSFVLGWWGLPFGPVFTIVAVISNLRGGKRRRVEDLLDELSGHQREVVCLTERAAENARRIISERGFSESTALQVEVAGKRESLQYSVTYDDLPPTDGSVWKSEAWGVPVLVRKRDERQLAGLVVDFVEGEYTFRSGFGGENG